jgi:SAM-dependent methyltransferase
MQSSGRDRIDALAAEEVEAWRSVAPGWERRRELFARATATLSARMVDLLEPRPGHRILELAAGPGETGFLALPRIQPDGELLSTDAAPEMVEAARRRAAELGLTHVRFGIEDAADLSLPDNDSDGILCRFGLMLVPEMKRVTGEIARVLRPGGRAVLAVWASSRLNPWLTAAGLAALELGLSEPPDHDAPGPFRLSDPDDLRSVVLAGGLEIDRVEDVPVAWAAGSLAEWWETTCDTSRMLTTLLGRLPAGQVDALRLHAEAHLHEYVADDGSLSVPGLARVIVATPA